MASEIRPTRQSPADQRHHHWDVMEAVARQAKEGSSGHCVRRVDGSLLYFALYNEGATLLPAHEGLQFAYSELHASVASVGIPADPAGGDAVIVYSSQKHATGQAPPPVRPPLLYPWPLDLLLDLLHGRLRVGVIASLGSLARAAREPDLEVLLRPGQAESGGSSIRFVARPDGGDPSSEVSLGGLTGLTDRVGYEFLGEQGFAALLAPTLAAVRTGLHQPAGRAG